MDEFEALDFTDFEREARAIVDRARETAREILMNALAEAQRLQDEARRRGLEEGRQEAVRESGRLLAGLKDDLERIRAELAAEAEKDLVRLAVAVARRIVRAEVELGRPVAEAALRAAIELVACRRGAEVRMHPDDLARIQTGSAPESGLAWVPDPRVPRGGCVVRTREGEVDARLETQLDLIERGLLGG